MTQRLQGLEQERKQVEYQRTNAIKWEHVAEHIDHFRTLLGKNLDRLGFAERQAVVQLLVEKGIVYPDGLVEVHHVLPFAEKPVTADQKKKLPPDEFSVLRLQHLHRPAPSIQFCPGRSRVSLGIEQGGDKRDALGAKTLLGQMETDLSEQETFGER